MLPLRTILVPTDFSEHSDLAYRFACMLARDTGAHIIALHVVVPPMIVYGEGVVPPVPADYPRELEEKLAALESPTPNVTTEHLLIEGNAADTILRTARDHHCDLIVIGTHGRTGLSRVLIGSVAEQVIRKAPCPVLTVKTPLAGAERPVEQLAAAGV